MSKELDIIDAVEQVLSEKNALQDDAFLDQETGLILTADMLVEGRHFKLDYFSPGDIGWKAGAVSLSDIAAMGGAPEYLLVSIGLPDDCGVEFVTAFYDAMQQLASKYHCRIIGGDTVGAPQLVINVTAAGYRPQGHTPGHRSLARDGDVIITTGYHGLSAVGLKVLQEGLPGFPQSKEAHLRPVPRIKEGLMLARHNPRYSLMDSSDGLADALIKIAQASRVSLKIKADALPIHDEVKAFCDERGMNPLEFLLYGGEDFQLVGTAPFHEDLKVHFSIIGNVESLDDLEKSQPKVILVDASGEIMNELTLDKTFQHFAG